MFLRYYELKRLALVGWVVAAVAVFLWLIS
jgi:hypothetical protein